MKPVETPGAHPRHARARSPIAWLGGKSRLADRIIKRFPKHNCYAEVFAGGAWVFFRKPESEVEVINDINKDLVTLYRCIQHHLPALVDQFRWLLVARTEFERFMATPSDTLTDIQRAAKFYYLNRTCFGAHATGQTFGIAPSAPPRLNLTRVEEVFSAAHVRLHRVYIEHLPYNRLIERWDRPDTLFYADPPYWGCEDDYGKELFTRADFASLAEQLDGIKGKFICSLNDTPGVRDTFANFRMETVETRYSVGTKMRVKELLISNF